MVGYHGNKCLCNYGVKIHLCCYSNQNLIALKIVFFSSSQDSILGIMESLLVCLKWCKDKVEQEKGTVYLVFSKSICIYIYLTDKNSKSVLYLHLLRCKTLQSTLKMFCENLEPVGAPTLSDQSSSTSSSNLSNHFLRVAIAAVDTVVFGTHAYKTEQVGLFISKELALPTGIRPNSKATVMEFTLAFTKFLLYYFHTALIGDPKKVRIFVTAPVLVPIYLTLINATCYQYLACNVKFN